MSHLALNSDDAIESRIEALLAGLRAAHAALADLWSITSPEEYPDLCRAAEDVLVDCELCEVHGSTDVTAEDLEAFEEYRHPDETHHIGGRPCDACGTPDEPGQAAGSASSPAPFEAPE